MDRPDDVASINHTNPQRNGQTDREQGTARLFLRPSGAKRHGHIGWSFSLPGGGEMVGSVEMPNKPFCLFHEPHGMGFWTMLVEDARATMSAPPHWQEWHTRYDLFKTITVDQPDVQRALRSVQRVRKTPWWLIGQNCLNDAVEILRAYGVKDLPPLSQIWGPIRFFNDVQAKAEVIMTPIAPVDATLYEGEGFSGRRYVILEPGEKPDLAAEGWADCARSLIVRSGHLSLFSEADGRGHTIEVAAGTAVNLNGLREGFCLRSYAATSRRVAPVTRPREVRLDHPLRSGPEKGSSPNMPQSVKGYSQIPFFDALLPSADTPEVEERTVQLAHH